MNKSDIIELLESIISISDEILKAIKASDTNPPSYIFDDLKRIDNEIDEICFDIQNPE